MKCDRDGDRTRMKSAGGATAKRRLCGQQRKRVPYQQAASAAGRARLQEPPTPTPHGAHSHHAATPMDALFATVQPCATVPSCFRGVSDVVPSPTVNTRMVAYLALLASATSVVALKPWGTVN